jgi:hypothetical protein
VLLLEPVFAAAELGAPLEFLEVFDWIHWVHWVDRIPHP